MGMFQRVPKGFVKRCWQEITNPVFLRLPNGTERRVYWIKKDGDVWFSNGWKEFAQYLSLEVSQFLVFRYEGKSRFYVIIFGKSALEIKYPLPENEEVSNGSDYSLKIVDDFDIINCKRHKSPKPCSQAPKKLKTNPKEEHEYYSSHAETRLQKWKSHNAGLSNAKNNGGSSRDLYERINAFHKKVNQNFYSENHWFTCTLQKTCFQRDLLVIPKDFARTNLHKKEGEATLSLMKDGKGRTWDVMIKHYSRNRLSAFVGGWINFVEDNNLKIGDVCVFVLNKCKKVSFQVVIFPFEDDTSLLHFTEQKGFSNRPSSCLKDPEAPKANIRVSSINHFTIHIKDSSYLTSIPMSFMRNYVTLGGKKAKLRVGKRTWDVKVQYYQTRTYARFTDGWRDFTKECNLNVGDSCLFEIIDEENFELNVSIMKYTH
ncbi:PREDICTED: B3 domain-containing transcription factor VRN1-like isoform X2 [Lupinus angustifolius]|uniref:B3 domain-containing transcription factor VRN1-like isoform X2 n=1 Tax=Lupinus angustifolius TaxID=3871 RepID=UPI00092F8DA2|nr:PREDICTED: B3 domain-containing transcription factor VRN1-like isoform X2 [Lupinus angustifolius]